MTGHIIATKIRLICKSLNNLEDRSFFKEILQKQCEKYTIKENSIRRLLK